MSFVGRLRTPRESPAPSSPQAGEMYYDAGTNTLYWWNGSRWYPAGGGGTVLTAARMYRNAAMSLANNSFVTVPLDTVLFDTHGGFTPASGLYTVPVAGNYWVEADLSLHIGTAAAATVSIGVTKNGTLTLQAENRSTAPVSTDVDLAVSDVFSFNQGDTIGLWVGTNYAAALNAVGLMSNRLSVYRITSDAVGPNGPGGPIGIPAPSTSMPASPVDGQLWVFPAAPASGENWMFRYNAGSSSPYKWEFVGGPPTTSGPAGSLGMNSAGLGTVTWQQFNGGPSLATAFAGDYLFQFGSMIYNQVPCSPYSAYVSLARDSATLIGSIQANFNLISQWAGSNVQASARVNGLPAGTYLTLFIATNGGSFTTYFQDGWMRMRPIRVG